MFPDYPHKNNHCYQAFMWSCIEVQTQYNVGPTFTFLTYCGDLTGRRIWTLMDLDGALWPKALIIYANIYINVYGRYHHHQQPHFHHHQKSRKLVMNHKCQYISMLVAYWGSPSRNWATEKKERKLWILSQWKLCPKLIASQLWNHRVNIELS